MEFKEYLAIIRRRWLLFFPIFLLIVVAHLVWVTYGQDSRYAATSKVIIGSDRALPARTGNIPLPIELSDGTKEATLTDHPVLRRAAELAAGVRAFQSPTFQDERYGLRIHSGQQRIAAKYGSGEEGLARLVTQLDESVAVVRPQDRQIVELQVEGKDASEALLLSWAMAEGAHQFHEEKARESFTEFLQDLSRKITEAEQQVEANRTELMAAQKEVGIANLAEKERMILENIYRLEDQESLLVARIRKNDRLIQNRLQEQSFGGRLDVAGEVREASSPRLENIRDRLFQAKIDLDAKISSYSGKHPEVHKGRALIAGLEKAMAREQEVVLSNRFQEFSHATNDLIKENALFSLEKEVLAERKSRLNEEIFQLAALRQEFAPRQASFEHSEQRLAELLAMKKDFSWYEGANLGSVVVYDPALAAKPVTLRGVGLGPLTLTLLMAFIFAIGVVYIVEYVDTRVKTENDIRRHLNLPLLGIIPKELESSRLLTEAPLQSEISEKFNTAATLIQSTSKELGLQTLMICSAIAREGKTTVSVNMAVALARKGARVVLIDGDLRISQIHNALRVPNQVGLSTALGSQVTLDGVMTEAQEAGGMNVSGSVQRTSVENLDVITSGPPVSDPVTLLESGRLARFVAELKKDYDFVIFDTPPINKVGDALTISSVVDGSIFVVGAGQAEQHDVTWAKHLLSNVHSNILGVFLNKFTKQRGSEYSYYYYYNDSKRKRVKSRA